MLGVDRDLAFTLASQAPALLHRRAAARLQARVGLEDLLARCPDFAVDAERGRFAEGNFVRRYNSLPFQARGLA